MYEQTCGRAYPRVLSKQWEETDVQRPQARLPERHDPFTTISGAPVERLYTPADVADLDYERDLGLPGRYPFTRGVHPTGYRGKLWTMRMFAGFGTAEETNARFKYLLDQGQTGLSVAFDMPTLYGYDTDAPEALGEFGKCGVAISSLADMEVLLDGLPLDQVTTSMTINSPAAIIWAMYIAAAEKRGIPRAALGGTIAERHPQGIHRAEGVPLPARALDAAGGGHDRVRPARDAEVEHDQHLRLSHPRGGQHRGAGAGLHAGRRLRLRRGGAGARAGDRRLRAAALVLLQRPQRLLRGDRQVPRGAAHLGADDAREVRRARIRARGCCARTRRPPASA